jgi:thioester reductase-like protein
MTTVYQDFCSALDQHAQAQPDRIALRFLHEGEADGPATELTFGQVRAAALRATAALQQRVSAGDRVLLLYEGGVDAIVAFLGCLYAGVVAVPTHPPDPRRIHRTLPRLAAIANDAGARLILASDEIGHSAEPLCAQVEGLRDVAWLSSSAVPGSGPPARPHPARPSDVAFLQYTSGSTGHPKGVVLTRDNLAWNCTVMWRETSFDATSQAVNWMPWFHDGGLLYGLLTPLYGGVPVTFLLPRSFLERPVRWLEVIHRYRGTHTAGPNFSFDLVTARVADSVQHLDLACVRQFSPCAEPVRATTVDAVIRVLGRAGLRPEAVCPAYGMAEAGLLMTVQRGDVPPVVIAVSARWLEQDKVLPPESEADARRLVGCGQAGDVATVAIVDAASCRRLDERAIGEIWVQGPGVGLGYWGRPDVTATTFEGRIVGEGDARWLRTGDLGFIADGELFVVGRIKDLIIVRGRNLHPQDLEQAAERAHPAVRRGCVAAFPVEVEGEERAALVAEVDTSRLGDTAPDALLQRLREAISDACQVALHDVGLLAPRSLFKTSSGKIQRRRMRAALAAGELPLLARFTALPPAGQGAQPGGGLRALLSAWIQETLNLAAAPPGDVPLSALGLDSLAAVELGARLSQALGRRLPAALLLDHPTLDALVAHLEGPAGAAQPDSTAQPAAAQALNEAHPMRDALAAAPDAAARAELLAPYLQRQLADALSRSELAFDEPLAEAGIDDVLAGEFMIRLSRELGVRIFPSEVLACGTLREVVRLVADASGPYRPTAHRLTLTELDERIASVYDTASLGKGDVPRDDPVIFILSPPRSGSTLLRVMLAGHSRLFAPQELHLAGFADMAAHERHLAPTVLGMGVIATLAELLTQAGAWNLYTRWKEQALPTAEAYGFLTGHLGGRILVDKSPLWFAPQAVIRRLARLFPNARFVHLVRHPAACIGSFARERFHGIFPQMHGLDPYDCGEWVWTRVNEGILEAEREIGHGRMHRLYFEDLASDPERTLRRLCPALGIAFEPALLTPYEGHRMVSGGRQVGDPNFTRHRSIRADKAEAFRHEVLPRALQPATRALAEALGYETESVGTAPPPGPASAETAPGGIDLERDARLPPSIAAGYGAAHGAAPTPAPRHAPPRSLFLTGATGFLGAFLVAALLRRTDAVIHCLVRAQDAAGAWQRLRAHLQAYGVWREGCETRLRVVTGDVGAPRLGMAPQTYATLRAEVDTLVHGAAQISWLMPYRALFASNVDGMRHVLEFAAAGPPAPLHAISSLGATLVRPFENSRMVQEVTALSGLGTESILELPLGYLQTKWVAERMVHEARRRGLPVTQYLPGLITGHSATGVDSLSSSQFIHALIKGSTQLGCFPDGLGWRFIPVDKAAEGIVTGVLSPDAANRDIHLDSASLLEPGLMVQILGRHGFDVRIEAYASWRRKVLDLAGTQRGATPNALVPFTDVIFALTPLRFLGLRHQWDWYLANRDLPDTLRAALEPRDFVTPSTVSRMVEYYIQADAMPSPSSSLHRQEVPE